MVSAGEAKSTGLSRFLHVSRREKPKPSAATASRVLSPETGQKFFREKGGTFHPAFGEPTQWDDEEGRLKAEERRAVE